MAPDSFGCATAGVPSEPCKIETTVEFTASTRGCGVMLRADDDLEEAYYIRLEPRRNRLVLDSWPRSGDVPYWVELERPLGLTAGKSLELKIVLDGSICEVYANNKVAMSTRMYNRHTGQWGVFVNEGVARFSNARLAQLSTA